jgi:hypothetical protein
MARKEFYVLLHVKEENSANQTAGVGTHCSNSEKPELSHSTMTMYVLLMTAVKTHKLLQTGYYRLLLVCTNQLRN